MKEDEARRGDVKRALADWGAPETPRTLEARVFASYRAGGWRHVPWWRALVGTEVRVPLPVAAAVLLLCVVSTLAALRKEPHPPTVPSVSAPARPSPEQPSAADHEDGVAVTAADLRGFAPTEEVKVTILSRGDKR